MPSVNCADLNMPQKPILDILCHYERKQGVVYYTLPKLRKLLRKWTVGAYFQALGAEQLKHQQFWFIGF